MGWWKPEEHPTAMVGDDVFNELGRATRAVVTMYERAHGRRPTREEWQILLHDALMPDVVSDPALPGPLVQRSRFDEDVAPAAIRIELMPLETEPSDGGR